MMMRIIKTVLMLVGVSAAVSTFAQNGQYDVRLNLKEMDCTYGLLYVDIDIRASSASTTFHLSEQNFRLSFNRAALAPASANIVQQYLTGYVPPTSFYSIHNLTGSMDTIVSYNVELSGGTGVLIDANWRTIGTLAFTIVDPSKVAHLTWHDQADFPPTFIGEMYNNQLYTAAEGNYENLDLDLSALCATEISSFSAEPFACLMVIDWTTTAEFDVVAFIIERSENGRDFEAIGDEPAIGSPTQGERYRFVDYTVNKDSYYRLRLIDSQEGSSLSEIIYGTYDCSLFPFMEVSIHPNPVSTSSPISVHVKGLEQGQQGRLLISDLQGRLIRDIPMQVNEGVNTLNTEASNLPIGLYLVRLAVGDWQSEPTLLRKVSD